MRDRSDAVPAYNDTPPDGPYLWNVLGFTRPEGDPLDNVGSTQRQDSLLKMGSGQVIDVDGIYLNMEWDVGYGTVYANAGKRTQDEHLPNTYTGAAPVNQVTGEVISLFDATRDTTRDTTQFEARFASDFDGSVNFVAGVFQQTNDAEFCVVQVLGFIDLAFDLGSRRCSAAAQQQHAAGALQQAGLGLAGRLRRRDLGNHRPVLAGGRLPHDARRALLGGPHAGRLRHPRRQPEQRQPVVAGLQRSAAGRQLQQVPGRHHRQ